MSGARVAAFSAPTVGRGRHQPIRVFHLIKSLGRGGAETLLLETLRGGDREIRRIAISTGAMA